MECFATLTDPANWVCTAGSPQYVSGCDDEVTALDDAGCTP